MKRNKRTARTNQTCGHLQIIWNLNDEPAVRAPHDPNKPVLPAFLPDPHNGDLYMLAAGAKGGALKRMPWTIPELVRNSPCKSSDGILYTGRKVPLFLGISTLSLFFSCVLATLVYLLQVDTWFSVDRLTGNKKGAMSVGGCSAFDECPNARYDHQRNSFLFFYTRLVIRTTRISLISNLQSKTLKVRA